MLNNKLIKQIFSQEIKEKLTKVGDFAYIVDVNDYVVLTDRGYIYTKQDPDLRQEIENLSNNYLQNLYNILGRVADGYEGAMSYEDLLDALRWTED